MNKALNVRGRPILESRLAAGRSVAPKTIAAVTFTELAASVANALPFHQKVLTGFQ